jgi:hypothetical protein
MDSGNQSFGDRFDACIPVGVRHNQDLASKLARQTNSGADDQEHHRIACLFELDRAADANPQSLEPHAVVAHGVDPTDAERFSCFNVD